MVTRREFMEALTAAGLASYGQALSAAQPGDRIARYPIVQDLLGQRAGDRARTLTRAGLDLRPEDGALALTLDEATVMRPGASSSSVPPDGLLVFAVDAPEAMWIEGELALEPDADRRPGLRATVLCDTTIVGAPMVRAEPWGISEITDAAPLVTGALPDATVRLAPWLMPRGRHYLTIAGPHFRGAGIVRSIALRVLNRPVEAPLYTFAFISDTHVRRTGREDWMNRKMGEASAPEFLRTLQLLADEGIAFVLHGGDLTERATRDEFVLMRDTLRAQSLPVYGCIGNHDRYLDTSRADARDVLAAHFPGGTLDYVLPKPPLRFVVFDVEVEREEARTRTLGWLRDTLRADTKTPTVFVWHYPPYNRGGVSNTGFRLQDWSQLGRETLLGMLGDTPNLCACLNGHDHWDEVNILGGLPIIQNAAFVEWPNTYRVYRVFPDRLEWEVRQVANRGYVRESFLPAKAVSWMMTTRDGDLGGSVPLVRSPIP
ncbi:MAG: metallophosphoesterase [Acidobacteriota bacterium]|nr:metallophosphoesterase [Acidobacteriota bacterium]